MAAQNIERLFSTQEGLRATELQRDIAALGTRVLLMELVPRLVDAVRSFSTLKPTDQAQVREIIVALVAVFESTKDSQFQELLPEYIAKFQTILIKIPQSAPPPAEQSPAKPLDHSTPAAAEQKPTRVEAAATEPKRVPEVICSYCGTLWKGWLVACPNDATMLGSQKSFWNRDLDSQEAKRELESLIAEFPRANLARCYEILSLVHSFKVYLSHDSKNDELRSQLENKIIQIRNRIDALEKQKK